MTLHITPQEWTAAESYFNTHEDAIFYFDKDSSLPHTFIKFEQELVATASKHNEPEGILGKGGEAVVKLAINRAGKLFSLRIEGAEDLLSEDNMTLSILKELGRFHGQVLRKLKAPKAFHLLKTVKTISCKRYTLLTYIPGHHLYQWRLNKKDTLLVALKAAIVLYKLHASHILFGDVKPDNIILDKAFNVDFIDFNFAYKLSPFATSIQWLDAKGTEGFKAPEVSEGYYDYKSDVFSLGKTFEKMGLTALASKMTNEDPSKRISLSEVILSLASIFHPNVPEEAQAAIDLIRPAFMHKLRQGLFLSEISASNAHVFLLSKEQREIINAECRKFGDGLSLDSFFIRIEEDILSVTLAPDALVPQFEAMKLSEKKEADPVLALQGSAAKAKLDS